MEPKNERIQISRMWRGFRKNKKRYRKWEERLDILKYLCHVIDTRDFICRTTLLAGPGSLCVNTYCDLVTDLWLRGAEVEEAWLHKGKSALNKNRSLIWSIIDHLYKRWLVSGKQRESDLDNKHTLPPQRCDGCTWPQVGERRASVRLPRFRLLMFSPPFLLNECQNAGFFLFKKEMGGSEEEKQNNKKAEKDQKNKRF